MSGTGPGFGQVNLPRESRVGLIMGVEGALMGIALIIWGLRIDTRWRILNRLWWDDLFISIAMVWSSLLSSCNVVWRHDR
jgi:hypothetical protein